MNGCAAYRGERSTSCHPYVQNEAIAREFAAYYDLFNKYRDDYRIDEILAGGDVAGIIERATEAEFDERLSLVGLLLDAVCGDMADIVAETDVLVDVYKRQV